MSNAPDDDSVPHIPHAEFCAGLPQGRFRIVVNPTLARPFVARHARINVLAIALIGIGAALALSGLTQAGLVLVVLGIALNRTARWQAGPILVKLAQRDAAVYRAATEGGMMEVRRA